MSHCLMVAQAFFTTTGLTYTDDNCNVPGDIDERIVKKIYLISRKSLFFNTIFVILPGASSETGSGDYKIH